MKKKALLVGINYPGTSSQLNGCINDVIEVSKMLTDQFGFKTKDKRMLTDFEATTAKIKERLEWLVSDLEPGDVIFFHYSGHGSQIVDTKYDSDEEPDKLDEILCPIDLDWRENVITDDYLRATFDRVPAGVEVTIVLDCCHSGSAIDQFNQYQSMGTATRRLTDSPSPVKSRELPMPPWMANRAYGLDLAAPKREIQTRDVDNTGLLISGCQSHQTSADAYIGGRYMGAATHYMLEILEDADYNTTYKDLVDKMNKKMVKYGYTQRPELNGSDLHFSKTFLRSPLDDVDTEGE